MPNRQISSSDGGYRFGFQGQEKDSEISGTEGGHLAFKYRIHDARLGRFLSVDPLESEYPWNSIYAFSENRVIDGIDLEGAEYKPIADDNGNYNWFEWDPDNAWEYPGIPYKPILKEGYYERAFVFSGSASENTGTDRIIDNDRTAYTDERTAYVTVFGANGAMTTFHGITTTSNPETNPIVKEGLYEGIPQRMGSSIYRDRLSWLIQNVDGSSRLPTVGNNPNYVQRQPPYAEAIFIHRTNNNGGCGPGVSVGCQVIDGREYEAMEKFYLGLSNSSNLPSIVQRFQDSQEFGNAGVIITRTGDYDDNINRLKNDLNYQIEY